MDLLLDLYRQWLAGSRMSQHVWVHLVLNKRIYIFIYTHRTTACLHSVSFAYLLTYLHIQSMSTLKNIVSDIHLCRLCVHIQHITINTINGIFAI